MAKPHEAHLRNTLAELEERLDLIDNEADRQHLEWTTTVLSWVLGDADEPDFPAPEWCKECNGTGGWSTPIEDAHGRSLDLDHECPRCGGSRVEP